MRTTRSSERGSVLIVALITTVSLLSLGMLAAMHTQTGISAAGQDRFQSIALYAAESGIAAGVSYLSANFDGDGICEADNWSCFVETDNLGVVPNQMIVGNQAEPDTDTNLFDPKLRAWYEVTILNNISDPGFSRTDADAEPKDADSRVILQSVGHGPNGTIVVLQVEVTPPNNPSVMDRCSGYGQKGQTAQGTGKQACMKEVMVGGGAATYTPDN